MEYILTEILKNAFRATVERHNNQRQGVISTPTTPLPPVLITVVPPARLPGLDKPATLSLRIRDQGGGVSPAHMARIFSYAFTTATGRRAHNSRSRDYSDENGDDDCADGGGPYAAQYVGGSAAIGADVVGPGGGAAGAGLFGEMTGMGVETGLGTIAGLGFGLPMSRLYAQ